jgi:UrcA family protein
MKNILYCLAIASALVVNPASATPASEQRSASTRTVSIGNLDLSGSADRATFDARIRGAARTICEDLNGEHSAAIAECVSRSIQKARPQRDAQVAHHVRRANGQRSSGSVARAIG